jgi:antitoxin VapB
MALNIKSREAETLIRRVADLTGETLTGAAITALRERLERLENRRRSHSLADQLDEIARRCAAIPMLDPRSPEDIIGYDEHGIPR